MGLRVKQTAVQNVVGTGASTGGAGDVQRSDGAGGFVGDGDLVYAGGILAIGGVSGSVLQIFNVLGNPLQIEPDPTQPALLKLRFPQGYPAGNNYLIKSSTAGILGYTDPATFATPAQVAAAVAAAVAAQATINTAQAATNAAQATTNTTLTNAAAAAQSTANTANTAAAAAQGTANSAQTDATNALANSAAAQTTANQGVSDAAAAQATANSAQTTANLALPASGLGAGLDALSGNTGTAIISTSLGGQINTSHGLVTSVVTAS